MRVIDSHFHWYPKSVFEELCKRKSGFPRAERNPKNGGYLVYTADNKIRGGAWAEWFDLDGLMAHENAQGFDVDVVCSTGPISMIFSPGNATTARSRRLISTTAARSSATGGISTRPSPPTTATAIRPPVAR